MLKVFLGSGDWVIWIEKKNKKNFEDMRVEELVNLWDRSSYRVSVSLEFRDWSCFASFPTGVLLLSIYLYIGILYQ